MKSECKCGLLLKFAEDPDTKFTFLEDEGLIGFVLEDGMTISVSFCPICGGKELGAEIRGNACSCQSLSKWAEDPKLPIEYDPVRAEYHLLGPGEAMTIFYYCPVCGGRLPDPKWESLYTTPSNEEMAELREKLKSASSLEAIVTVLGDPDEKHGAIINDPQRKRIYNLRDVRETFRYTSLATTLDLVVQEYEDGEVHFFFTGKQKTKDQG